MRLVRWRRPIRQRCRQTSLRSSVEHSLRVHQLGIEHGSAGRAPHCVMPTGKELVIEDGALPQTADEYGHSVFALDIATGLRTILLRHVDHRIRRSTGETALLWHALELLEGFANGSLTGLLRQLDGN